MDNRDSLFGHNSVPNTVVHPILSAEGTALWGNNFLGNYLANQAIGSSMFEAEKKLITDYLPNQTVWHGDNTPMNYGAFNWFARSFFRLKIIGGNLNYMDNILFLRPATACAGQSVSFNYFGPNESGITMVWDFGDGTAKDSLINPPIAQHDQIHTFTNAGTYIVSCTLYYPIPDTSGISGCTPYIYRDTVTITGVSISSSGSSTFCDGQSITLTSSASSGNTWKRNGTTIGLSSSIIVTQSGTYSVTTSGHNGCASSTATIVVTVQSPPAFTLSSQSATCNVSNSGSITINSLLGTSPYEYTINGTTWIPFSGTSVTISSLAANTYTINVRGANGCSGTGQQIIVGQMPGPAISETHQNVACKGTSTGSINITATAGTGLYNYDWAHIAGSSNVEDPSGLSAGTYSVTVTDSNGCIVNKSIVITEPALLFSVSISTTQQPCINGNSGILTANPSGGNAPYSFYTWSPVGGTTSIASELSPGSYTVSVADSNGCVKTGATILSVNTACCGSSTSQLISASGNLSGTYSSARSLSFNATIPTGSTVTFSALNLSIAANISITVQSGATLIITNGSDLHACGEMWTGIKNQGGTVIINSSTITNALTAVSSSSGSPVRIEGSVFDQNWISLSLNNGSYPPGTNGSYIRSSTFKCTGGYLTAPLANNRPHAHIYLTEVDDFIAGDVNAAANYFHTASYGIYSKVSSFDVVHSNFDYSQGGLYTNREGAVAIYAFGLNQAEGVYPSVDEEVIRIGGPGNNEPCLFNFWETGINTFGVSEVHISNNYLNDCFVATIITTSSYSDQLYNTLNDCRDGLGLYNSVLPPSWCLGCPNNHTVEGNYFNIGATYQNNPFGETAINVQNSMGWRGGIISIRDNYINNSRIGVHVLNIDEVEIDHVYYTTDIPEQSITDMQYGIWVQNSDFAKIKYNHITWYPGGTIIDFSALRHFQRGISIDESLRCILQDNAIDSISAGINVFNDCAGSNLYCNQMNACFHGVYFDDMGATSYLSTQGVSTGNPSTSETWKNEWVNNVDLKVGGTIWSGYPLDWVYDPSMGSSFDPNPSDFFVRPLPGYLQNSCTLLRLPDEKERNQMFGSAVGDSTKFEMDSTEYFIADKEAFYTQAKDDSTILNKGVASDAVYQEAFYNISQTNIGKYEDVKDLIVDKDVQMAWLKLAAIQDENLIDQNKRTIASILLSHYDPLLDTDEDTLTIIRDIALQHPFYGGEAAYWARGILHMNVRDQLPPFRRRKPGVISIPPTQDALFPNPAQTHVSYSSFLPFGENEYIRVNNNVGQQIGYYKLPVKQNTYKIAVAELEPGMYFIRRISNNKRLAEIKLIIIKQ